MNGQPLALAVSLATFSLKHDVTPQAVILLTAILDVQLVSERANRRHQQTPQPLEWTVPHREGPCYAKLICVIPENNKVVGFHVTGPNAGEMTQGFGVGIRCVGARLPCVRSSLHVLGRHSTSK